MFDDEPGEPDAEAKRQERIAELLKKLNDGTITEDEAEELAGLE